jgi:hypothetical protein
MVRGPFSGLPSADEGAFDRLRSSIDPDWIEAALEATGTATLRRRRLPAEQVIWLVLGIVATGDVGAHFHRHHRYPGTHPLA